MPSFDIVRKNTPTKTFRVASIIGSFDLENGTAEERFVGEIDLPKDWQIGLIVGNSGTGKTTIARELFPDAYFDGFTYSADSLLDDMPKSASVKEITTALTSVGFSSVPSWLKPYAVLSNGEKMRCDLARAILEDNDLFVFDEFTSVVDRNVAKIGSFAMQKAIRKTKKKFIAVTCHFDVEDWLLPDWVFDTNSMTFRVCEGQKKNRPTCRINIYETKEKKYYWRIFGKYHYLSHSHNNAARVFIVTIDDELCGFFSVLHNVNCFCNNLWKAHRHVVLPDYQGIGICRVVENFIGELLKSEGKRYRITSSSPQMINMLKNNKNFKCVRYGRMSEKAVSAQKKKSLMSRSSSSCARLTGAFDYIRK